jgi:AGZA family xanthine/uracil permease-like MFS transporter
MATTETRPTDRWGSLDSFFQITARGSTLRTEVIAGLTTWLTMAYILFVNPSILGAVKDHSGTTLAFPEVLTVTALVAGVMTILMGVVGKYPFALAAGLGLNAFVAFTLVGADKLTWPEAMGVIVAEGVIITILVLTNIRELVLNAIPMDLKRAIGVGIGAFIALIGLVNAGIVVHGQGTIVTLTSDIPRWSIGVFIFGLLVTSVLIARRVKGALLIGIIASTIAATIINEAVGLKIWHDGIAAWPHKIVSAPHFGLVGNFSFHFVSVLGWGSAIAIVLSVMLSDFFDTMGTVIGIGEEAGMLDQEGRLPGIKNVLLIDSLAAVAGGLCSASSNTTFIESASGVSEGGRTGLASVLTGVLFLLALFISPIAGVIPPEATAPALVIVGYFMISIAKQINWDDPGMGIPALLTVLVMPFTYSITNGVGAGFLAYISIAVLRGRAKDVHWLFYLVGAAFAYYFVHGVVG